MFHIPKNLKPLLFRVRLPKIPVVGKAIFRGFGCFTTKYLKMVSQAKVRKTLYVLLKFVIKRGSR
ncbi:hypothetical protein KSS87_020830, partial [Heliosperma pusillum]